MKTPDFNHFCNRLNQLFLLFNDTDSPLFENEIKDLAWTILWEIRCTVDLDRIGELHTTRDFPTYKGLREALQAIEADYKRHKPSQGNSCDAQRAELLQQIAEIKRVIEMLEAARSDIDTTVNPSKILALQIEPRLQALLENYRATNIAPRSLRACLRRRVLMLGEELTHILWNSIKEEIREQHEAGSRSELLDEFGQFPGVPVACTRIVAYMLTAKLERPLRVRRIIEKRELPPSDLVVGLSAILTWGDQLGSARPTLDQQQLAINLQRLVFPLRKLTHTTARDVLSVLGTRNLRPSEVTKYHFPDDDVTPPAQQVFHILWNLIWHAHRITTSKAAPKRLPTRRNTQGKKKHQNRRGLRRHPTSRRNGRRDAPWTVEVDAKSSLKVRLKTRPKK